MKNLICLALILFWENYAFAQIRPALERPNIIVILTDDQGYADVGFNGSKDISTPGIDRIANDGVVFKSGYVSYAVCGPSRAGLITGRYQDRFGFSRNPLLAPKDSTMGLPLSEETIADLLKRAGYKTGAIGKWHLGAHPSLVPNRRGFDEFFGFLSGGHHYFPEKWTLEDLSEAKTQFDGYRTKLLKNEVRVDEQEYLTDAFSREALNFIKTNQAHPFFLYLAYNAPHTPMQATEKYLSRFPHIQDPKRKTYAAMVSAVDDGVDALLDLLKELEIEENTIVFFLSDNGGPTKDNASNNQPLRGFKGDFFEGGVRVPFAMQWKGQIPGGQIFDSPVISLDIFATAASVSKVQPKHDLDGVDLIPFLKGQKQGVPHEELYWRNFDANRFAMRAADSKIILQSNQNFLFDLGRDISESQNRFSIQEDLARRLAEKVEVWKKQLMDPIFLGLLQDAEYSRLNPDRFTQSSKEDN
ncbi:sulfatase-like hydrolase/transferase [Algoriphagus sp. CAU 1675]|uniref:sulfatase-like hydrolase/transferase n=1 Tax=Algoriphagus sp. CAU 1675 TaxID=3032597 RepID=UPI0023DA1E36|nr:sulfatase-like hydrolase/transferase [Algoriphagus sp. CAU 1675]MDF2159019.1 sulfatase-like hydrolase/transferase [Algoriphagus sp. CAU 1675]